MRQVLSLGLPLAAGLLGVRSCQEQVCAERDALGTRVQKRNVRLPWSGTRQLRPLVLVTWAADGCSGPAAQAWHGQRAALLFPLLETEGQIW